MVSGFEWIGSYYATVAFATATVVEVLGYCIPWLDHALDIAATPAADVTGVVMAGVRATLGLFIIPAKRRQGKTKLIERIAGVCTQLIQTLRGHSVPRP